jgi:hypothetical protein
MCFQWPVTKVRLQNPITVAMKPGPNPPKASENPSLKKRAKKIYSIDF